VKETSKKSGPNRSALRKRGQPVGKRQIPGGGMGTQQRAYKGGGYPESFSHRKTGSAKEGGKEPSVRDFPRQDKGGAFSTGATKRNPIGLGEGERE